jgi:hypothetical protein
MELSNRIEHQWAIIDHINSYIQAADNKAGAALAVLGIMLGFLLKNDLFSLKDLLSVDKPSVIIFVTLLVFCLWVVLVVTAIYYALLCLVNRTGSRKLLSILEPAITRSSSTTIYFGQICDLSETEYKTRVLSQDENDVLSDLISQTHILSKIAIRKYSWLSSAYLFTAGVLIVALIMMGITVYI